MKNMIAVILTIFTIGVWWGAIQLDAKYTSDDPIGLEIFRFIIMASMVWSIVSGVYFTWRWVLA